MLVCHKNNTGFEGRMFQRGDMVDDPALEAQILERPEIAHNFSRPGTPVSPAPTSPSAPFKAPAPGNAPDAGTT